MLSGWDVDKLTSEMNQMKDTMEYEMNQMREVNEAEIAERDHKLERAENDVAMIADSAYTEKQLWIDREMSLENVIDELKDENVHLIGINNNNLWSRIAEQSQARVRDDGNSANKKVIEDLQAELRKANSDLKMLQDNVDSNPKLGEALLNVEQDEAERWKKMYLMEMKERDQAVMKNASLYVELQDANKRLTTTPTSSVVPTVPVPSSPSAFPSTSLCPMISPPKAKTPSFAMPGPITGGTPKISSVSGRPIPLTLPPPVPDGDGEAKRLREELTEAEARSQRNYDEMKEYQSWLQQVEEGQETLKGSNADALDPVPDNPPGLWGQHDGQNASLGAEDQAPDLKDWITRISRKEHEKITIKPWPKCQDLDVWRSNVVQAVCVASGDPDTSTWRAWLAPAQQPDPDYTLMSDSGDFRFQSVDCKLSIAMQNMVDAAGEVAYEVKVKIRQRSQELGKKGNFLMGREIFAMILDHFRTTSKDEVLFNASHIYRLQYRGDKEMDKFLNAWLEIIANMKPEDIPSEITLRDHLLRKIEGSQALHVDLTIFKSRDKDDRKKTYQELWEIMKRHMAKVREDKNMAARDKFATDYTNLGKPTTPAAPAPNPKDGKGRKPSAPAPEGKPGAPVLSHTPYSHTHTHTLSTHNLSTHNLLTHTHLVHTQLVHTQLTHTHHFACQAWHLATSTITLRDRRGTWRHGRASCVA